MAEPQVWGFPKEVAQRLVKSLDGQSGGTVAHPKPRYFEESPLQPILLRNDSNEAMPAYGIGLVTGFASVNGAECLIVTKPTTTSGTFVVNGPTSIAATGSGNNAGHGFRGPIVKVKYYSSDNPTIGQIYGVSGWTIRSTGSTLTRARIIGQIDTTEKTCFAELLPDVSLPPTALVKNISPYTVPEWGFLQIDGVNVTPTADLAAFKAAPVFLGVALSLPNNFAQKRIVSVPSGAAPGDTVECILDGRVPARIYSQYRTDPKMVQPGTESGVTGVSRLAAAHDQSCFGYPVLYRETGTGEKWGVIDLMPQNAAQTLRMTWTNGSPGISTTSQVDAPINFPGPVTYTGGYNGIIRKTFDGNWIRIDGPSAWMGEFALNGTVRVPNGVNLNGLGWCPMCGYELTIGFDVQGIGAGTFQYTPGIASVLPSAIHAQDTTTQPGHKDLKFSVRVPCIFQTPEGLYETTGFRFRGTATLKKFGVGAAGLTVSVTTIEGGLYLQEIDPLSAQFSSGTGTTEFGSLSLGGPTVPTLFIQASGGPYSGKIIIEGSATGGTGGTGTGAGFG